MIPEVGVADSSYLQFFGDDFLRLLLLRYVFCDVVLHLHRAFRGRQYRPRCQPPLPEAELLEHPSLQHLVLDLAAHLEVRTYFMENHEIDWSRASSSWQCVGFSDICWELSSKKTHGDKGTALRIFQTIKILLIAFTVITAYFWWNVTKALLFIWTLYITGYENLTSNTEVLTQFIIRKCSRHKSHIYSSMFTLSCLKFSYFWTLLYGFRYIN